MRTIFTVLGLLMLATTPLVLLIPDAARERRLAARAGSATSEPETAPATPAQREPVGAGTAGRSEG